MLVGLTLLALAAWERDRTVVTELWSWPLALAAGAVAGGWYVLATMQGGMAFVHRRILYENIARLLGEGQFSRPDALVRTKIPFAFITRLLPWNLAIPWIAWRGNRDVASPWLGRLLHCWWLVPLLVFTAAAGQRGVYLLPVYPAVAVFAGTAVVTLCPRRVFSKVLIALAIADLILVTGIHATRRHRMTRGSLLPFATAVDHVLPEDAVLAAHASCHSTDVLVLAYRLDRRIMPAHEGCAGTLWCVAPKKVTEAMRAQGYVPVLRSRQGTPLVLLQRHPQ